MFVSRFERARVCALVAPLTLGPSFPPLRPLRNPRPRKAAAACCNVWPCVTLGPYAVKRNDMSSLQPRSGVCCCARWALHELVFSCVCSGLQLLSDRAFMTLRHPRHALQWQRSPGCDLECGGGDGVARLIMLFLWCCSSSQSWTLRNAALAAHTLHSGPPDVFTLLVFHAAGGGDVHACKRRQISE